MPIAAIVNGNTYAVHSDHLNTPRKLTDASGQAAWQWSYSAFGEDKPTLAKNRFANLETMSNPGTTSVSEVKFNLRYPGQYADEESGLFYNYFRSYDARTGRYSQPDPIGLDGGWNRFGYVDGNPLKHIDPYGLEWLIDPGGRSPESTGLNTLYCEGQAPAPYVPSSDPTCPAINACARKHEGSHILDALLEKPNICRGNRNRVIIVNDNDRDRLKSEEVAHSAEIQCLEEALKSDCETSCRSRINSRANVLKWILENQVKNGRYP
jgi:RHS repeat-associated protein